MAAIDTAAETKLITVEQMKKVREVDLTTQFTHNDLNKMFEVLGVTRKIAMMEGTTMYVTTISGTLESGDVDEGNVIPLSQYQHDRKPVGDIKLKKWRKAVSAEAIKKSGYDAAVAETDTKMISDVRKGLRTDLFKFLNGDYSDAKINGTAVKEIQGKTLQETLAKAWGQLQVLFEDDTAEAVYFVNPLDIADYLATASITTQTVFGMNYVKDFLGLGTVIISSQVTEKTVIATAKQNFIYYYLTMSGDIARAFSLTTDETGYIGIKSGYQNEERAQIESLVMMGGQFLVEYIDGVVKGTINPGE